MSLSKNIPPLYPAVSGQRFALQTNADLVSFYQADAAQASALPPLLLVHSVNAAASAFEVAPLYEHYRQTRPTYAIDLPGYGFSERGDRPYTIRLMTDAVLAVLAHIRSQHGGVAVDMVGVSLSSEYVARVACERPQAVRRLAIISPTGFSGSKRFYGVPGSSRGMAWFYRAVSHPAWSSGLFNTLVKPGVVRYFLQRSCGATACSRRVSQKPSMRPCAFYRLICLQRTSTRSTRSSAARSGCQWPHAATSPITGAAARLKDVPIGNLN